MEGWIRSLKIKNLKKGSVIMQRIRMTALELAIKSTKVGAFSIFPTVIADINGVGLDPFPASSHMPHSDYCHM